jgi:hypothetical protein|tara:strand:+ start:1613 stop:2008 length:396 start_codon:yes stop_codon:yes gene_type:complete
MWRQFRESLDTGDTLEVCSTVVSWWKSAPISSMTIDPVTSGNWPTPWEMLHSGDFCENSLALGMSYTIYYANQDIKNELIYVTDKLKSTEKLCSLIGNKHLLNFDHGVISTLPSENIDISYRVSVDDIVNR